MIGASMQVKASADFAQVHGRQGLYKAGGKACVGIKALSSLSTAAPLGQSSSPHSEAAWLSPGNLRQVGRDGERRDRGYHASRRGRQYDRRDMHSSDQESYYTDEESEAMRLLQRARGKQWRRKGKTGMPRFTTGSDSDGLQGFRSPENFRFPHIETSPDKKRGRNKKKYQPPDLTPAEIEQMKKREVLARRHEQQKRKQRRLKRERIRMELERERIWDERSRAKQQGFSKNKGLQSKYKVSGKPGQDYRGLEHKPGGYGTAGVVQL